MTARKDVNFFVAEHWSKLNNETDYYKYPCSKCKLILSINRTNEQYMQHVVNKKEVYCSKCIEEQKGIVKQRQMREKEKIEEQKRREELENVMRGKEEKARLNLQLLKEKYWSEKKTDG